MTQDPNESTGAGPSDETVRWTPPPPESDAAGPSSGIEPAVPPAEVSAASAPVRADAAEAAVTGTSSAASTAGAAEGTAGAAGAAVVPSTAPGASTAAGAAGPEAPAFEPADDGPIVRREPVARESGTLGAATGTRRSSGLRWAIALAGVAIVAIATIAIVALASGRPATSIAVGYMPEDTIQYAEYRFDLPGDQHQKLAAFMSHFPGFADQASLDTKIDEVLDRLLSEASKGEQTWTADIKPWFGGQIAMGSGPLSREAFGGALSGMGMGMGMGPGSLVVVTVKDAGAATAWVRDVIGASATSNQYGDATVISGAGNGGYVIGINDEVMLAGPDATVRAAIDSKGDGKLADDAVFQAAFKTVGSDYVAFGYTGYRAFIQSMVDTMAGSTGSGLDQTTVDDKLIAMVPEWMSTVVRVEADSIVAESAFPSIDFGFDANNKRSTLAGNVPPGTVFYAEAHDVGAALTTFIDRLRAMPELRDAFRQIDQGAGMIGGLTGVFGWWGDVGIAVGTDANGDLGGGLLIAPTDVDAASRTFTTLRSFIALGGGQAGIAVRDVAHGDSTITVIDFSKAAGGTAGFPPGFKPEIAYAVTKDVAVIGYGEAWVASVLDAGPGPSLADDARYKDLLGRAGEENLGVTFIDVTGIRALIEPLVQGEVSADEWAFYRREIVPYLENLDAVIGGARQDGGLDRGRQVITVK
jgi:uncharacterized protein DUF3352